MSGWAEILEANRKGTPSETKETRRLIAYYTNKCFPATLPCLIKRGHILELGAIYSSLQDQNQNSLRKLQLKFQTSQGFFHGVLYYFVIYFYCGSAKYYYNNVAP